MKDEYKVVKSRSDKHPEYGYPLGEILCANLEVAEDYVKNSEFTDCFILDLDKSQKGKEMQQFANSIFTFKDLVTMSKAPLPYERLTKVSGDPIRHIEQLWDEVNKLKERVKELEKEKK